ncbi:MAG: glycosyltransferase family 2 protein [Blastocatellia bacterium]|nr:glycosyltransferase family 2 protein [Blastocatellia bacterium]
MLRFLLLLIRSLAPGARGPSTGARRPAETPGRGCAILIAAHNEEGTIGATVTRLRERLREWPESRIWVVADRCADATAAEAERAGAQVALRSSGGLGKCAVITWWLEQHESAWRACDAVLILDADTRLAAGSLRALREAMLIDGAEVVQAFVAPLAETGAGRMAGWSEVLMQRIDDEARRRCGWSVPLRGTGMAFRGERLAEIAPRLHTLAEDLEMDVLLAARGVHVRFVPAATIYDPKPQQADGASRQRARWLQGQLQVLGGYWREIGRALATGGVGAFFLLFLLLMRPKIALIGLRLIGLGLSLALLWFVSGGPGPTLFAWTSAGLVMDALYYLAGARFVDDPRRYLIDLLTVPRYAAMWLQTALLTFSKRRQKIWLRAGR